jgi:hypothetical protein
MGAAFVLGFVGFQEYFQAAGVRKSGWDVLYLTLQLFVLDAGAVDRPVGPALQVARFLAPVTTAYALVQATLALFAFQLQRTWLWWRGGHVVVCGLGRKGLRLVKELRKKGRRVVVIEHDPANDDLARCRALGAVVLIGRANDEWILRMSHVDRADEFIAVTGDDATNVETAVRAHQLNLRRSARRRPLKCVVHVQEPRLRQLIHRHQLYADPADPFELELFNIFEVGARAMLREPPLLPGQDGQACTHLVVIGMGQFGEALVRRALKDWRIDHPVVNDRMRITVVDRRADQREEEFRLRYPHLVEAADLRFVPFDIHSVDFAQGKFLSKGSVDGCTGVYVCLDNDSTAISAALTLRQLLTDKTIPIVVRMADESGLASLLHASDDGGQAISGIRAVGLLELTCQAEAVLGGPLEVLAQSIHQVYLHDQVAGGQVFGSTASLVPWDRLSDDLKESNRLHARHVAEKLALVGCEMVPSIEEQISLLEFTPVEIERLAMAEHRRWVDERRMLGWKFAPVRDHAQKLSPYLVAWDQLTEEVKEVDRVLVRRIPANLAKADYQVRRIRGVGAKNPSDASADAIQLNPEFTEDEPSKERQEHQ